MGWLHVVGGLMAAATGLVVFVHSAVSLSNRHPGKMNFPTGPELALASVAGFASGTAAYTLFWAFYLSGP